MGDCWCPPWAPCGICWNQLDDEDRARVAAGLGIPYSKVGGQRGRPSHERATKHGQAMRALHTARERRAMRAHLGRR